ncbi:zincin-like metallopeptidase domain-containing protein [Novispirillum itersonii]|uniref:zincin-like metallopeptidase domain-containing protein n=1 Tax=Novispirillum itersonii TaxID=189 RepID=UPI0003634543|nr:zincin-like metallopeptidase domain-containing protein [Novispirillum itersonii]
MSKRRQDTPPKEKENFRDRVVAEMIRHIEAGTAPWQKPWKAGEYREAPMNPTTGKAYRGMNAFWLEANGYADPRWMTYKQAQGIGAQVRKGEQGWPIEYWQYYETKPMLDEKGKPVLNEDGQPKTVTAELERPRVFRAVVFNASQIDGLEPYVAKTLDPTFQPVAEAEKLLAGGGVEIRHDQNNRAFYSLSTDRIHLPPREAFHGTEEYYATALHELAHATGHPSRLDRDMGGGFGSENYAKEELRAEMAAYMVNTTLGLGHHPERHAAYVGSWLSALKEDRNLLFQAARDAETIQTWISQPELRPELRKSVEARQSMTQAQQNEQIPSAPEKEPAFSAAADPQKPERVFLAVPYAEKEAAKAAGAKWDPRAKSWYVGPEGNPELLQKWAPTGQQLRQPEPLDPYAEFAKAAQQAGLQIDGLPVMDGKWHRVPLETDKPGSLGGAYKAFLDGKPAGLIRNYQTMAEPEKWVMTGHQLSPAELEQMKATASAREAQRRQELEAQQTDRAKVAAHILSQGKPMTDNPYLNRKQVQAHGLLRHEDGSVMVPCKDAAGELWNIQFIKDDGEKRFLKGGKMDGLMHRIEGDRSGPTVIAEGFATAASIHEATGLSVVVAFNAGNLPKVAQALHRQDPSTPLVIAADDDFKTEQKQGFNPGLEAATQAATLTGAKMIQPPFTQFEREQGRTDWNDYATAHGKAAVAKALENLGVIKPKEQSKEQQQSANRGLLRTAALKVAVSASNALSR